jgi:hypothetical protein
MCSTVVMHDTAAAATHERIAGCCQRMRLRYDGPRKAVPRQLVQYVFNKYSWQPRSQEVA